MKILVTGGAGFIGSHIVDELVKREHSVTIIDNLEPQVHPKGSIPSYLNPEANFIRGDVRDDKCLREAIENCDVIFHEAAMVGVGQSMYQIRKYVDSNNIGTANLLDLLVNTNHDVKKIIVAASMSSYGEGNYRCLDHGIVCPPLRPDAQMKKKDWELHCPKCSRIIDPIPTDENKRLDSNSIYAITKKDQEEMVLNIGKTYGIPSVALRYFNVFGPRQSLSNPYTGVAAIFMSMIKNDNKPIIFEDGQQTRDFISVHDIVSANMLAMEKSSADYNAFNVGSGSPVTIKDVALTLAKLYGKKINPKIENKFRKGDVRHCYADITKIRNKLGFEPKWSFEDGMQELIDWARGAESEDKVMAATDELRKKGLLE